MNAIGLIETMGLIPAIEAADIMLKTAQVALLERSFVGGGLVTITVTGDVGAVKAAVDAGVTAVLAFGSSQLKTHHVIPRPHNEVETLFMTAEATESLSEETNEFPEILTDEGLSRLSVKKLRELGKKYDNLGLTEQGLAMANKATLLKRFNEKLVSDSE